MLKQLTPSVGGYVKQEKNKEGKPEFVKWVMDDKKAIQELIKIFERYPPLTTRLCLQLKFMLECFEHKSVEKYLATRGSKYDEMPKIIEGRQEPKPTPPYFEV